MKNLNEKELLLGAVRPYFRRLGYTILRQEQSFGVGARRMRADLVVYTDDNTPFAVVEVKRDFTLEALNNPYHPTVQQTLRYALVAETPYFVITNGHDFFWYQVDYSTGVPKPTNPVPSNSKQYNLALFHSTDEANQVLHSLVEIFYGNTGLSRVEMISEVMRILRAKAYDEQRVQAGVAQEFYVGTEESNADTVKRIEGLLQPWPGEDDSKFLAPADQITLAVSILQSYSLLQSDKRYIKPAFDQLISGLLRQSLGQYITPYPILEFLVGLLKPLPGESVLDPFCGTAGFLTQVLATWHTSGAHQDAFDKVYGIDIASSIVQIAKLNLVISGGKAENIILTNSLNRPILGKFGIRDGAFDVIVSNPPIGMDISDVDIVSQYRMGYTERGDKLRQRVRIEELYIEQFLNLLKPGGRAGFIVPEGILASSHYRPLRKWLMEHAVVDAVISLPAGIWESTGIKTSILIVSKQHPAMGKPVFMGVVDSIGVDKLGRATKQNDLLGIAQYYHESRSTQKVPGNDTAWSIPNTNTLIDHLDTNALLPSYRYTIEQLRQLNVPTVRLRELTESMFQGARVKTSATGIPIIGVGQIRDNVINKSTSRYIDQQTFERNYERLALRAGDVVITSVGQIGQAAIVRETDLPIAASESIIVVRLQPNTISGELLVLLFSSRLLQDQMRQLSIGASLPHLTTEALGSILVPLPDQETQHHLVAQLQQAARLRAEADNLEQDVLRQLTNSFEGNIDAK